jgi:hypothetical protein
MGKPHLIFACELEAQSLKELFTSDEVIAQLKLLQAHVSLGILDFSPERTDVVRQLNKAGIPLIAWLLLPKEQGYWFNQDNSAEATSQYGKFKVWTAKHKLHWAGIGLDIEFDIRGIQELQKNRRAGIRRLTRRYFNKRNFDNSVIDYRALVTHIRTDGYFVESYQIPFIVDERKVGTNFLQRMTGLVDLSVDREVLMLYSSFLRDSGTGILWSYGKDAQAIGVGSTGGGVELDGVIDIPPLTWEEFQRDLLLAHKLTEDIFVFSLEGCVQQGFLKRLLDFDWNQDVLVPSQKAHQVERYRKLSRGFLWMTAHPWLVALVTFTLGWLLFGRKRPR